ncbi:MAG: Peptidyl-tRNA hydrolase [Candidatus Methanolliviera sp. GoM_asphalt]|nr:MAG: Peptidyl-tRNA hydrolase [Candidatus Methanolliviera sp. GoM_asphalt]
MKYYKQCIVVRSDLKLSKGKLAAQVAHASLSAFLNANILVRRRWLKCGQKKVVLKVSSLDELMDIKNEVNKSKLPYSLIKDAGLTHIPPGTITTLGIGPEREDKIDEITGHLKML